MQYDYIDTPHGLRALVDELRGEPLLAVDTEAAGYHRYFDRLSLVQVSTRGRNFLIDPFTVGALTPLGELLHDRV